ncbi:nucleoside recognition domain-containing protein [Desulfovibrio sp. X2]|uniref:hypothetical protein n=1 Tax=Desulfovibrio sp. X2 TaxID=941449 RepID=UPI0003589578|nr:hypothetical protein [Desulfovibrio sp. X2]EPR43996.1 nucleoside recognition domain-containing protein [Desulfovibrio sp. X2]
MSTETNMWSRLPAWLLGRAAQTVRTCLALFKVMVPVVVLVKVLQVLDLVGPLSKPFGPIMGLVGLPAVFSLAWVSAMLNSMYAGLIVFAQLAQNQSVTAAQATVLATMMLVAHNLLVETVVARASGPRASVQLVLRLVGALALGALLNRIYLATGWLQGPAQIIFTPAPGTESLLEWGVKELRTLGFIACIIFFLVVMMGIFEATGLTDRLNRLLAPMLRLCGIGPAAAPITVIGVTLGLAYGGGLIIEEARSGRLSRRDVVFGLSLMALSHSLIEDTMLMILAGAHLSGILWGRLLFSLAVIAILVKGSSFLSEETFSRIFWHGRPAAPTPAGAEAEG